MTRYARGRSLWGHSPDATSLIRQQDTEKWDQAIADLKGHAIDIKGKEYGAVGNGTADDSAVIQAALTDAYTDGIPIIAPPGIYKASVNYKGQEIVGAGPGRTTFKSMAGQDILHFDSSIPYTSIPNLSIKGVSFLVDDSTDASASFPQRGGVGHAAVAVDFPNGAAATYLGMYLSNMEDVKFLSTSFTAGGQNKSCGIYCQGVISLCSFRNIQFWRLRYGFWHDSPTSNVASGDFGADHNKFGSLYFNGCDRPFRLVNPSDCEFETVTIHSTAGRYGMNVTAVQALYRSHGFLLRFGNVMIEEGAGAMLNGWDVVADDVSVDTFSYTAAVPLTIDSNNTVLENVVAGRTTSGPPDMVLNGNRITVKNLSGAGVSSVPYGTDMVTDNGKGNRVEFAEFTGATGLITNLPQHASRDSRILHARDASSILLGHAGSTLMVGGDDLLVNPLALYDTTGTKVTDWNHVADSTAEFGWVYRRTTSAGSDFLSTNLNGNQGWYIGKFLPATALQVLICWKASTGGTMVWYLQAPNGTTVGTATLTATTSYAVASFTADLAGKTVSDSLRLVSGALAGGGAYPLSIAWVAFRPYTKDQYVANSTEPVTPVGGGVLYAEGGDLRYKGSSGVISKLGVADPFNTQTGTAYTLVLADSQLIVGMNNAAANTLTVPPNASVAFPTGTVVTVRQVGAGLTTVAAGSGVTINSRGAVLNLAGRYAYATLVKVATNTWELSGDIA